MKKSKRILSAVMAIAMICVMLVMPVMAQTKVLGTDVNTFLTNNSIVFTKNLIIDAGANVPDVKFTFLLSKGSDVDAPATPGESSSVYAGTLPTSTTATISYSNTSQGTQHSGTPDTPTDTTHEYYSKTAMFDFTGADFDKPGIYRYTIVEQDDSATYPSIDFASNTYTLDLYIGYDSTDANTGTSNDGVPDTIPDAEATGTMSVLGYGIYANTMNTDGVTIDSIGTTKVPLANFTFPNTESTEDLVISKQVAGTLGDKNAFFDFSVTVGGTNGYKYALELQDLSGATLTPATDNKFPSPAEISANTALTIALKDGQQLVVKEVPTSIGYTIQEQTVKADGYTVSVVSKENGTVVTAPNVTVTADDGTDGTKVVNSMVAGGNIEAFTNTKNPTPPMGVLMQVLPFVIVLALACAGLILLMSNKRKKQGR